MSPGSRGRTARTAWAASEWRAAREMGRSARPPDDDERTLGELLEEMKREREERRRLRRAGVTGR